MTRDALAPVLDRLGGFPGADDLLAAWRRGMTPEPALTVSAWADSHRKLGQRGSAEPGPWRTARTPYLQEIMDALSPSHPARRIVFMKGAQIGGTEAGNNWIGYVIAHAPGPMLAVQPTSELAKRFSDQRIDPLIEETPALKARVAPARSRDSGNRQLSKEFPGGQLVMAGANSAVGLRSMSARFLFLDEVDAYPGDVDGEGDPIALAEARARTFGWRRKLFLVSTPTITGTSRIEREYDATDRRRYFVPCPHCDHMQTLRFQQLKWPKGEPDAAEYHCEACCVGIAEHHKTRMLARGEWRATAVPQDPHAVGYHLSALYSPVGWLSWAQIARDWQAAQADPRGLKTFTNTVLGETWTDQGEAPDWQRLYERAEPMLWGVVPADACVLTAGLDNQAATGAQRVEMSVWAWGPGLERWLVDTKVFPGSPGSDDVWDAVAAALDHDYPREGGGILRIARAAADTGGQHTADIYRQIRRLRHPALIAVKGVAGFNRASPVQGPSPVDVTEAGRKIKRGLRLWTVAGDVFKAELYRALWLSRDGEAFPRGWVHLPQGLDPEHVKQLVAETLVTVQDRRGFARQEWRQSRPNEQLDMAVYARAALSVLGADRYGERFWNRYRRSEEPAASSSAPAPRAEPPALSAAELPPLPVAPPDPPPVSVTVHRPASSPSVSHSGAGRASRYAR